MHEEIKKCTQSATHKSQRIFIHFGFLSVLDSFQNSRYMPSCICVNNRLMRDFSKLKVDCKKSLQPLCALFILTCIMYITFSQTISKRLYSQIVFFFRKVQDSTFMLIYCPIGVFRTLSNIYNGDLRFFYNGYIRAYSHWYYARTRDQRPETGTAFNRR